MATLTDAVVGALQTEPTLITLFGSAPSRIKAFDELGSFGLTPASTPWAYSGAKLQPVLIVRTTRRQIVQGYQDEELQEQSVRQVVRLTYFDDRANGYGTIEAAMGVVHAKLNFQYFEGMRLEYQDDDLFLRTKEASNAATVNETFFAYGVHRPYTYG